MTTTTHPAWPAAVPLIYVLAFAALLMLQPLGRIQFLVVEDIAGTLPPFVAGCLGLLASRKGSGHAQIGWLLIGAGCVAWGVGEAIWTYHEVVLGQETPFPSLADVGYLGAVPLLFAGILILTAPRDRNVRLRVGLDALAVVAAAGAISWHFVLHDTFTAAEATTLEKVLSGLYPLGDLALLFSLVVALPRMKQGRSGVVLAVFAAGMVAFLIADSLFAYLATTGSYSAGSITDGIWVLGTCLFGYSAYLNYKWRPDYFETHVGLMTSGVRQLVPIAMLPFMIAWPLLSDMSEEVPTALFIFVYAVLVVARQAMNWLDSLELNRHLVALNTRLEARTEFLSDSLNQERDRANRDPLTGVLTRRAILEELEQILAMPSIVEEVGAIGVADVDLLKEINDTRGHSTGDEALRRIANALSFEGAIVGRLGGDEFVMILPGANEVRVEAYLALVDWRLQSSSLQDANDLKAGFSAGFALYPAEARNSRQLLKLADERMYAEKQRRRVRDRDSLAA